MKIVFCDYVSSFSRAYQYGGVQVKMFETARWLIKQGHEIEVHASPLTFGSRVPEPAAHMDGIPYFEAWRQSIKADVAYVVYYSPLAWQVLFSLKCPKIAGLHAPGLLARDSLRHHLFRTIGSQDLALFDAVRVVNPIFKFKHRSVFNIPDSADTKAFTLQEQKSDKFTVLYVGRHHRGRGWDTFMEVASQLTHQGYDFDFVSTGDDNELSHGLGSVEHKDMPEVYSKANVLVHPVWADTFGIVIIEALACGIPVITTPIPAHRSLEIPLIYAHSTEEFTQQILKIYSEWRESSRYEENRLLLRQSVLKYDTNTVFPQLEEMFISVVSH